jgi:xylulokinase
MRHLERAPNAPSGARGGTALIGLDLGTSSLKALALDSGGRVLAEATAAYPTATPHPGWAEQDPEHWWTAAGTASRTVAGALPAGVRVVGVGLSGQMHTFALTDGTGVALRPAVTWMDTRAGALLPDVRRIVEEAGLAGELGNPVVLGLSLPPLLWLLDHEADALRRATWFLAAKDWLRMRMTGAAGAEATDASATLLFDVPGRRWSTATCAAFGIPTRLLPPLGASGARAGALTSEAARHLGLPAGIPVAFGAGDQQAAAVGTGTVRAGQAQLMVGTGAQALAVRSTPVVDGAGRLHAFAHVEGWLSQASVNSAGAALGWAKGVLGLDWAALYATLDDPDLHDAPLFLPYLTGERTPLMKGHARGAWLGLGPEHGARHLARAAVEGVVVAIADGVATLLEAGAPVGPVRASGGGLREGAFAQAVADAIGHPLDVLASSAASAVGAALLGGIAAGVYADVEEAADHAPVTVAATIAPRPERTAAWAARRAHVRSLDALGLHEAVARRGTASGA